MKILQFSTSFPLALDEKVEVRMPFQHTSGMTLEHQIRFQIDPTIDHKNAFTIVHDTDGRLLAKLPNFRISNVFHPHGYRLDGDRDVWLQLSVQAVEGGYIVGVALMENVVDPQ